MWVAYVHIAHYPETWSVNCLSPQINLTHRSMDITAALWTLSLTEPLFILSVSIVNCSCPCVVLVCWWKYFFPSFTYNRMFILCITSEICVSYRKMYIFTLRVTKNKCILPFYECVCVSVWALLLLLFAFFSLSLRKLIHMRCKKIRNTLKEVTATCLPLLSCLGECACATANHLTHEYCHHTSYRLSLCCMHLAFHLPLCTRIQAAHKYKPLGNCNDTSTTVNYTHLLFLPV